jgi:iron complex transport system permease protein
LSSRLPAPPGLDSGRFTLPVGALTACLGAALLLVVVRRTPSRTF